MERTAASVSPTRRTFSDALSAFGAKLSRTLSRDAETSTLTGDDGPPSITGTKNDRSVSRGREVYSSGRGGAGNMRASSTSRDPQTDEPYLTRGREGAPANRSFSIGRGGAGNVRSPSRGVRQSPNPEQEQEEERAYRRHLAATEDAPRSSGRGGVGNIHSPSRSRSRDPSTILSPSHSTGRGGAGNIMSGGAPTIDLRDELERKERLNIPALHSTGRGGAANITSTPEPANERVLYPHHEYESTGRGGAGNIVHDS